MATNREYLLTNFTSTREQINDIGFRVMLVPIFGIAIPLITQLVPHDQFTHWQIKFSYLFTISMALIIYEGCRYLLFSLRTHFDWLNQPFRKVIAIVVTVPFFCVPVSFLLLISWYHLFLNGQVNWAVVKQATAIITVIVFFMVNVYEIVFAVREMAANKLGKEQLERAMAEAQLEALKNQIDPHFIFNSLNTLSHLIEDNPVKARHFNDSLAEVYRYILLHKASKLVFLGEEINFLRDYFSLLQIRFEGAIQLHLAVPEAVFQEYFIPPISLQLLVENAIKHNEFSEAHPMQIHIVIEKDNLVVTNLIKKKSSRKISAQIGLRNLSERYLLTTNKAIVFGQEQQIFFVRLPLLSID